MLHLLIIIFVIAFSHYVIEPYWERKIQLNKIKKLSWLFPISLIDVRDLNLIWPFSLLSKYPDGYLFGKIQNFYRVLKFRSKSPEILVKCSLIPHLNHEPAVPEENSDIYKMGFFGKNPPTYRRYVHSAEVIALQKITEELSPLGVKFNRGVFYSGSSSQNILLLGSDANTELSGTILDSIRHKIDYKEVSGGGHRYFIHNNKEYRCKHEKKENYLPRVRKDYGIIVKKSFSDRHIVLLCAGIHMHGTLGAAMVVLRTDFQDMISTTKLGSFAQLICVKVLDDGTSIDPTSLESWKDLPLEKFD